MSAKLLPPSIDDLSLWPEMSYALDLTDGLPVHPPLRSTVDALIAGSGLDATFELGTIPPRDGMATVEVVAANAAMAGALPQHMPIICAAVQAMAEPEFNFRGVVNTTHSCWPLVVVSGDAVAQLGMSTAESVFSGGGSRANAAIGRTIKLLIWNAGAARPGEPVKEVFGHPGRFAFCIGETTTSPWEPLHVARGVDSASGVTVFACESPMLVAMWGLDDEPETRLEQVADSMRHRGSNNTHTMGEMLVLFTPAEARHLAASGWDRRRVQEHLYQRARRSIGDLRPLGALRPDNDPEHWYSWWPDDVDQSRDDSMVPVVNSPDAIHVVVAGADSIPFAAVCHGWGHLGGYAVSRAVEMAR